MIRIARALAASVFLVAACPLFAGTIERFLLPRTTPERAYGIAATADFAWVIMYSNTAVAKVGLDGSVLDVIALPYFADRIATDPVDGSLWYASHIRLGHLTTSGEVVQFDLPVQPGIYAAAQDLVVGPDGFLWISRKADVLRVSRSGEITTFANAGGYDNHLASGPDGNVWVTNHYANWIGRMTPSGTLTIFSNGPADADFPNDITAGSDGNLWFGSNHGSLRKITTAGAITSLTSSGTASHNIVSGADGRLWWSRAGTLSKFSTSSSTVETTYAVTAADDHIWDLSASASGVWWGSEQKKIGRVSYAGEQVSAPFNFRGPEPWMLASSADYLWFTAAEDNRIGRVTPANGQTVLYTLPHADSRPLGIVAGPDAMWFTEENGDRVGRIDAGGTVQEFTVPVSGGKPTGIAHGTDGNLWITLAAADQVVRMTTGGVFTQFALAPGCQPTSIAMGPDSALWFTCEKSKEIGRITLAGAVTKFGAQGDSPTAIALASDGNLWYTTYLYNHRITPAGVVTSYAFRPVVGWRGNRATQRVAGPDGALWDNNFNTIVRTTMDGVSHSWHFDARINGRAIAAGPDGKMWFSDSRAQALYRFDPDAPMTGAGMTVCPQGSSVNGPVAFFTDPDTTRGVESYTAAIDWGDGTYPTVAQISMPAPGRFVVSGYHTYAAPAARTIRIAFTALPGPNRLGATAVTSSVIGELTATPSTTSFPSGGGSGTVTITGANCPWTASVSNTSVITLGQPASGQGAGSFQFTVTPNNSPFTRTGNIYAGGSTITITQAPHPSAFATGFYTIEPCRLVDTRITQNPMPEGSPARSVWIPAGTCGIPSGAKVLSANVTAVSPSAGGWLAFYAPDTPWPGNSTLNYRAGQTRANNALLRLASDGFVVLNHGPEVHFIVDVNGYFK